jgi:formate hydrogenlyase subunit 6/NADH:ubiquinone oxidoreductase subunit I
MKFGHTRLGKMAVEVLKTFFQKPNTVLYPAEKIEMPEKFRGKLKFYPEKCIGCQLCVKDCPSNAIKIKKLANGKFEAEIDLDKCIYCAQCVDSCPRKALEATKDVELAQLDSKKLKIFINAGPQEKT